jgi:hypothetical protein
MRRDCIKMEAENGVKWPPAKKEPREIKIWKRQDRPSPGFHRAHARMASQFCISGLQNYERINLHCSKATQYMAFVMPRA